MNDYVGGGRGAEGYFAFLRERYRILLRRREGLPPPWTDDEVLRAWRFCNVRREDDRVTTWFRDRVRGPLADDPRVLFAVVAFRWFNTIETGEAIRPWLMGDWDRDAVLDALDAAIVAGRHVFTGAFMISSAPGKPKHVDVLDNLGWLRDNLLVDGRATDETPRTSEGMMRHLLRVPFLGNFSAYQAVVDLQQTYLLRDSADRQTFTVAGPGCAKGIGLCLRDDPGWFRYGSRADQTAMTRTMIDLRGRSLASSELWPIEWPPFELSDVENGFCEYAKWRTGHSGLRLKRRFEPRSP